MKVTFTVILNEGKKNQEIAQFLIWKVYLASVGFVADQDI